MIKTILKIGGGLAVLGVLIYAGLPKLLNLLGLHPHYKGRKFFLPGKKALIITTSQDTLEDGKPTGVYARK